MGLDGSENPDYMISPEDSSVIKRHQIMSHYHWSYSDYMSTPAHVIAECYALIKTELKVAEDNQAREGG